MMVKLIALSALVVAQATPGATHASMMGGHMAPATMVCRPVEGKEHGNAMLMPARAMMMCKTLAPGTAEGKAGPDVTKALTPAQVNAAWQRWLNAQFDIPVTGGG